MNQIFNFQKQSVRIEFKNGEPLFCLTDVAEILLIKNANPTRFNLKKDGVHKMYTTDTMGREKEITYINEPNLYRVIFRSNKPEAIKFQDWIFEEVIPQIRKTGTYSGSPKPIPNKTTSLDREPLRNAVNLLVSKKGLNYSEAYTLVHQRFNVAHLDELDSEQIPQAVEYVHRVLCGEVLDRLPEKTSTLHLTEQDLRSLSCVIRFMPYLLAYYHLTEDAVRSLNRRLCGTVHDRFQDGYLHACHLTRSLNIEQQDWRKAVQEIQLHANLI